ncbi:hypothetical protein P0W64_06830 [Tsukamurella sp. 8F]|uniref:hypothetical protein n=1 Tax=unclassified Tsukamurella TaxID=2633480 RepID=UPI0023B95B5E|nr:MULTISPECIES: hypothetical protein [unclassified Tsukamurella]MDF0530169.1 hypothetical protein [Tsukamurella sp. 8J]MDF0586487.1 hypothetical protein [Tsukamurella sp. 8F]
MPFITATVPPDVAEYLADLDEDRRAVCAALYSEITDRLGRTCEAVVRYGMISWVLPPTVFAPGYEGDPDTPLPFISLASQRSGVTIYHLGLYQDERIGEWFRTQYARVQPGRVVDVGTTSLRFADAEHVPVELIGELAARVRPVDLICGAAAREA